MKKNGDKLYVTWKGYDNLFNSWIDKKDLIVDVINVLMETLVSRLIYLIMQQKLISKNVSHVDANSFALKSNLASLKTEVDRIDAEILKTFPVDRAKLTNVVKNGVIKKTEYDKLVAKVNGIDNTNFVSKT